MSDVLDQLQKALAERYAVQRAVGAGGMATVYLAEDLRHHRLVAIKLLRPELASALGSERFLLEIALTARLNHPHILPVLDSGDVEGFLFFVMPYVEGETLRDRLNRELQLPIDDALQISRELADALGYAHRHGVIHRDIKPENILISSGHAILADFGIAKAISAAGGERLTAAGVAIGTPGYMSPEQAAGGAELDGRSDLYSLGCVLFELLAGQPPFTGPTPDSVIRQHVSVDAPPVTNLRPAVPPTVAKALARALAKTPADRFEQVTEFGQALRDLAPSAAIPTSVGAIAHRNRWWIAAAALALAAAAAAAWTWRAGRSADPDRRLVVVPPFENRTGDTSLSELGELAANWVADAIVRDGVAESVPSTVVQDLLRTDLRGSIAPAAALARRTGARTAIIGEYHRNGDGIEFRGALVAMPGAKPLFELDPVTGAAGSAALFNALELQVLQAVQSRFEDATAPRSYSRPSSVEAYRAFVRGEQSYIEGDFSRAAELHAKAAALDTAWTTPKLYLMFSVLALGRVLAADSLLRILEQRRGSLPPWDANMVDQQRADFSGDLNAAYQAARRLFAQAPRHWGGINLALEAMATNRLHEVLRTVRLRDTTTAIGRDYFGWYAVEAGALHVLGDHGKELDVALERLRRFPVEAQSLDLEIAARAAMGQQAEVTRLLGQATGKPVGWSGGPGLAYMEFLAHGHEAMARAILPRVLSTYEGFATRPGAVRADSIAFATALSAAQNSGRAREWWQRLASVQDTNGEARLNLAYLAAREGDRGAAARESDQWALHPPAFSPGVVSYRRAQISADLGDKPGAIALLRQAFAEGYPFLPSIHHDLELRSIWNDPGFRDLLRPKD